MKNDYEIVVLVLILTGVIASMVLPLMFPEYMVLHYTLTTP